MRLNRNPFASALALTTLLLAGCGMNPGNGATYGLGFQGGNVGAFDASNGDLSAHHKAASGDMQLYVLPDATDSFLIQALNGAKKVIRLECYMLTNKDVIGALEAAKTRGVAIQVLLEPHPFNPNNPANPLPTNLVTAKVLAAAGIPVVWTSPDFKYTHAKFIVVDDQTVFVSTANFTGTGLMANREYVVADQAPVDVADMVQLYEADYAHAPFKPSAPDLVISPVNSRNQIMNLIQSAQQTVQIGVEIAADPAIDALIASKTKQGVHVTALLSAPPKAKSTLGVSPNVATAQTWLAAGAQVRYQNAPFLHAKEVIVDNARMYVGSVNLSTNSMDNNREVGLVITDPALIQPVAQAAAHDWQAATPVALAPAAMPAFSLIQRLGQLAPPELCIEN